MRYRQILLFSLLPLCACEPAGQLLAPGELRASSGGDDDLVMRVEVTPAEATLTAIGATTQLSATGYDDRGREIDPRDLTLAWSSLDAAVATVDAAGSVTARSTPGSARIIAAVNGRADTAVVRVEQRIATVTLSPASVSLAVGESAQLTAEARDASGTPVPGVTFAWSSSDTGVATVDANGVATGAAAGRATLSATADGVSGTAALSVAAPAESDAGSGPWSSITAGDSHSCAVTAGGSAYCWGYGFYGQLGNRSNDWHYVASLVADGHGWRQVVAGNRVTCGTSTADEGFCWGEDVFGAVGDGPVLQQWCGGPDYDCINHPSRVALGQPYRMVAGGWGHSCGVATDGRAYCWGVAASGELGSSEPTETCFDGASYLACNLTPVLVDGGLSFREVTAGYAYTCGLTTAGQAYCWGHNASGQLGDGTTLRRSAPAPVAGGLTFASLRAFFEHTCGLTTAGEVYCWGSNLRGQLGDGTFTSRTAPVRVAASGTFRSLDVGAYHACAVDTAGQAWCWGWGNMGQLGDGLKEIQPRPVAVSGGYGWVALDAGYQHTCGVTESGEAYCWGINTSGQLGIGSTNNGYSPYAPETCGSSPCSTRPVAVVRPAT